jgi:hypothetical protein
MICTNPSIVSKACENTAYFTNLGRIILDLGPHISQNNPAFFQGVCFALSTLKGAHNPPLLSTGIDQSIS